VRSRIAVLASGEGSNLEAILEHFAALGELRSGDVVLVASDRAGAPALARARRHGISAVVLESATNGDEMVALFATHRIDLIALAGYLRLLPNKVVATYRNRIVNVHPAPLPQFGGTGMYGRRVHEAVLASGVSMTGVTVHFVDEQYDHGDVIAQWPVAVNPDDTPDSLAERVLAAEHVLFPRVIDLVAALNSEAQRPD
jgi:formyltetrahydrofolate-dependent phosphoribosylglycinamide formyltransferase